MKTNILLFPSHASYHTQEGQTLVTVALSFLFTMCVLLSHQLVARVSLPLRNVAVKIRSAQDEHGYKTLLSAGHAAPGFSVP